MEFKVGDEVKARYNLGDPPSEDSPGGVYAFKGDKLIIRNIVTYNTARPIHVSHENILDRSFSVSPGEIEKVV